jgi:hypothetical protein
MVRTIDNGTSKTGFKAGKTIAVKVAQAEVLKELKQPTAQKKLQLKLSERIELELKFQATELKEVGSLDAEPRLASVHLSMGWWLLQRDLAPDSTVRFLKPEVTAQLLYSLHVEDAAEAFVQATAKLKAQLRDAKLIFVPVWGNGEHWTLVSLQLGPDKTWTVEYRDSLTQEFKQCREAAEMLMTFLAVVLETDLQLPPRCNKMYQLKGSGHCGQFVLHWIDMKIRVHLGQGHAVAYPDPSKINQRLQSLQDSIVKNVGIVDKQEKLKADAEAAQKVAEAAQLKLETELKDDAVFQEAVGKVAKDALNSSFGVIGGCSKCAFASFGSTCCNPLKIEAKQLAEEKFADEHSCPVVPGQFDKIVYNQMLVRKMKELADSKGITSEPPGPSKPAGGQVTYI